jgi:3-dehydroquinate dehydratase/shikimate dehydrogenase
MICVSIAQSSRTLAKVDILNAAGQCDLIEVRLDAFDETPVPKDFIGVTTKPLIFSCRRSKDGGNWDRDENSRLTLLRQAVLDKAAWVEIEVDAASQIRRYGETKRIISYTNLDEVPSDLEEIYQWCCQQDPDVVKITVPSRTPEEAWPIIKTIAKGSVPTVAVGIGRNGVMLSVLGQRYKAPWIYAALEKGMEAYPGMVSIRELDQVFDTKSIDSKTPLVAVSGNMVEQALLSRLLNTGFRKSGGKMRCLPLDISDLDTFAKIAKATKLEGVFLDEKHRVEAAKRCTVKEERVELGGAADFIAIDGDTWKGFSCVSRAVTGEIEDRLTEKYPGEDPIAKRQYLIVGGSATARSIGAGLKKKDGSVILADADNERAKKICAELGFRYMPAGQTYQSIPDAIVICADDKDPRPGKAAIDIPRSNAREGVLAVDLSHFPYMTGFLQATLQMGGVAIRPADVLVRMLGYILRAYNAREASPEDLRAALADIDLDNPPTK